MHSLVYPGDQSARFDPETGTGLLGRVMGPDDRKRWWVVSATEYHAGRDQTTVVLEQLQPPGARFDQMTGLS